MPGLNTQLSTEAQLFFYDQLRLIGKSENLDLFLYTRGGQTDSIWPLVNLFREYSKVFSVLIPFRAHSAGTLLSLGANKIIMSEAAELSPIDPTTGNQFNPLDETNNKRRGISVEDVTSYIDLAKDTTKVGLQDSDQILEVFKRLSEEVHPLALGNVNRVHNQIKILAEKLLQLHLKEEKEKAKITKIVDQLTRSLYSHTHAINRREAKQILGSDLIVEAEPSLQKLIWELYEDYAETLNLRKTLCQDEVLEQAKESSEFSFIGAFIESENRSFVYKAKCEITVSSKIPKGINIQVPQGQVIPRIIEGFPLQIQDIKVLSFGWEENTNGD